MKTIALILILSTAALHAQSTIITAGRPDAFGRTVSTVYDSKGRMVGTAYTSKPDYFGRTKTTLVGKKGKVKGSGITTKPDSFGRRMTRWLNKKK